MQGDVSLTCPSSPSLGPLRCPGQTCPASWAPLATRPARLPAPWVSNPLHSRPALSGSGRRECGNSSRHGRRESFHLGPRLRETHGGGSRDLVDPTARANSPRTRARSLTHTWECRKRTSTQSLSLKARGRTKINQSESMRSQGQQGTVSTASGTADLGAEVGSTRTAHCAGVGQRSLMSSGSLVSQPAGVAGGAGQGREEREQRGQRGHCWMVGVSPFRGHRRACQ